LSALIYKSHRSKLIKLAAINIFGCVVLIFPIKFLLNIENIDFINSFVYVLDRREISSEQVAAMSFKPFYIKALFIFGFSYIFSVSILKKKGSDYGLIVTASTFILGILFGMRDYEKFVAISIVISLTMFLYCFRPNNENSLSVIFLLLSCICGVLPILTDWDTKYNDVSLPVFCLLISSSFYVYSSRIIVVVIAVLGFGAVAGGINRQRMHDVGVGNFWEATELSTIKSGYFAGLNAGPRLNKLRIAIQNNLKNPYPLNNVFCGPRIEFCYADNNLISPTGLPLWWHPGSSYPVKLESQIIFTFKKSNFDKLIFLEGDRTRMPQEVLMYIKNNYHLTYSDSVVEILGKNKL
jgi:hypothetical protein